MANPIVALIENLQHRHHASDRQIVVAIAAQGDMTLPIGIAESEV
jgi:hypothetical protein